MRLDEAVDRLTRPGRFETPLPEGPVELMPVFTDGRFRPRLAPTDTARPSAVLALLFAGDDGEARIVLTERIAYDGHHSGEVSLPGGKPEPGDPDIVATALREAAEEVALDAEAAGVSVLGRLDDLFIPVSGYRITPVVAVAGRRPVLAANPAEVARILEPPIRAFLPGAAVEIVERTIGGWPLRYGGYRIDGLHVWGATARILGRLGAMLGDRPAADPGTPPAADLPGRIR
jgi:8-oxo-dGTP pyrophosphatase MutT (NUDIX family)